MTYSGMNTKQAKFLPLGEYFLKVALQYRGSIWHVYSVLINVDTYAHSECLLTKGLICTEEDSKNCKYVQSQLYSIIETMSKSVGANNTSYYNLSHLHAPFFWVRILSANRRINVIILHLGPSSQLLTLDDAIDRSLVYVTCRVREANRRNICACIVSDTLYSYGNQCIQNLFSEI